MFKAALLTQYAAPTAPKSFLAKLPAADEMFATTLLWLFSHAGKNACKTSAGPATFVRKFSIKSAASIDENGANLSVPCYEESALQAQPRKYAAVTNYLPSVVDQIIESPSTQNCLHDTDCCADRALVSHVELHNMKVA